MTILKWRRATAVKWFKQIGAQADAALVVDVQSADDLACGDTTETATLIYLPGGDPVYLVETLRGFKPGTRSSRRTNAVSRSAGPAPARWRLARGCGIRVPVA